jgi:hypothetical protein
MKRTPCQVGSMLEAKEIFYGDKYRNILTATSQVYYLRPLRSKKAVVRIC